MRVVKVLNNSLVLAIDEQDGEIILMGKGIGFHKSAGYEFRPEEVEKVFVLKDREVSRNIIRLSADTDAVYFEISKSVIDYAKEKYGMQLMEHIYPALTDHLAYSVKRQREGINIEGFYTNEIQKFNPSELDVGRYALGVVEEKTGVALPKEEAGNIAFHFINAQINHQYNDNNRKIRQLSEEVLNIVKYYYQIEYDEQSYTYSRYLTYVRLFAQCIISDQQLPDDRSGILYDSVAMVCTTEFECVEKVSAYVKEKYGIALTNQEALYLVVHVYRVLREGVKKG